MVFLVCTLTLSDVMCGVKHKHYGSKRVEAHTAKANNKVGSCIDRVLVATRWDLVLNHVSFATRRDLISDLASLATSCNDGVSLFASREPHSTYSKNDIPWGSIVFGTVVGGEGESTTV